MCSHLPCMCRYDTVEIGQEKQGMFEYPWDINFPEGLVGLWQSYPLYPGTCGNAVWIPGQLAQDYLLICANPSNRNAAAASPAPLPSPGHQHTRLILYEVAFCEGQGKILLLRRITSRRGEEVHLSVSLDRLMVIYNFWLRLLLRLNVASGMYGSCLRWVWETFHTYY